MRYARVAVILSIFISISILKVPSIPKVHLLLLQNRLWELACKFHALINAKI